jgi:hypothetical protein
MTPTFTPTITPTLPPTNTPTATPRAAYDFTVTFTYQANTSSVTGNSAGCKWTGIGGRVINKSNAHITGMIVRLTGGRANVDFRQTSGHKSPYYGGSSGWEHFLNNSPQTLNDETFALWLEYSDGKQASDKIAITTKKNCTQNLVLAIFTQQQDRATATQ